MQTVYLSSACEGRWWGQGLLSSPSCQLILNLMMLWYLLLMLRLASFCCLLLQAQALHPRPWHVHSWTQSFPLVCILQTTSGILLHPLCHHQPRTWSHFECVVLELLHPPLLALLLQGIDNGCPYRHCHQPSSLHLFWLFHPRQLLLEPINERCNCVRLGLSTNLTKFTRLSVRCSKLSVDMCYLNVLFCNRWYFYELAFGLGK